MDFKQSKLSLLLDCHYSALTAEAQKAVYLEFYTFVYRVIVVMVKEHAITEDIIQEAFLKVIKNVATIENESKLKAWIRVVVKNTVISYLRKNKRSRNDVDADSVFINDSIDYATDADTLENEVELKVIIETIDKWLQELKPEYRVLVELRWKHGMSYKEIADYLDVTEPSVKSKLHRARESIKKRFVKEWGEPG